MDLLMKYGADVDQPDRHHATALHWCFFANRVDSLKTLIKYKPDTSATHKLFRITAMEGAMKMNNHEILRFVLQDEEMKSILSGDLNMTVHEGNVGQLIDFAIVHNATDCLQVIQ